MEEKIIIKQSGEKEFFNKEKFCNSLANLGLNIDEANKICEKIYKELPYQIKSSDLFKIVSNELKSINLGFALKYNLKKAIYKLGPSGFPFEKYVGKILAQYGFETFTNFWVEGKCLSYETDILAIRGNEKYAIECKFHHKEGTKSDLKTILYVFGRAIDIKEKNPEVESWFITNTKITSEGINFAECRKLKITAWKYPKEESLEKLIENKFLYPITILFQVPNKVIKILIENNIVLLQDFDFYTIEEIQKRTGLDYKILKKIKDQIELLLEISKN